MEFKSKGTEKEWTQLAYSWIYILFFIMIITSNQLINKWRWWRAPYQIVPRGNLVKLRQPSTVTQAQRFRHTVVNAFVFLDPSSVQDQSLVNHKIEKFTSARTCNWFIAWDSFRCYQKILVRLKCIPMTASLNFYNCDNSSYMKFKRKQKYLERYLSIIVRFVDLLSWKLSHVVFRSVS